MGDWHGHMAAAAALGSWGWPGTGIASHLNSVKAHRGTGNSASGAIAETGVVFLLMAIADWRSPP